MGYIQPSTYAEFFGNLGLSDTYTDTFYFSTPAARDAYFDAITPKFSTDRITYQREHKGTIRVECPMGTIYNASYMRFKNSNIGNGIFENKWFYAFVKSVNYINNVTAEVVFEMDYLMSWMGTFTLGECFIDRQHTVTDNPGDNIVAENLDIGYLICQEWGQTGHFEDYTLVLMQTVAPEGERIPYEADGIFSGIYLWYDVDQNGEAIPTVNPADFGSYANTLESLVSHGQIDQVIYIGMLPTYYLPVRNAENQDTKPVTVLRNVNIPYSELYYPDDGTGHELHYIPKNKKLFTYPYSVLEVYNSEGQVAEYRYEHFNYMVDEGVRVVQFEEMGIMNVQSCVSLIPLNYKGHDYCYTEALLMQSFPSVAWGVDTYRAFLAQKENAVQLSGTDAGISALIGLGGALIGNGAVAGKYLGEAVSSVLSANIDLLSTERAELKMPVTVRGTQSSDFMVADRKKDFYFYKMHVDYQHALMIDDYFTMYGYAIKRKAVPNMAARPKYTFLKTVGCVVEGNIPADDATAIEKILNKGIRFWRAEAGVTIGDYSVNNSPV